MERLLEEVEVSVNKNAVASDTSAISPGGLRLGTPAMTSRGMDEGDMRSVADVLLRAVALAQDVQKDVTARGGDAKLKTFSAALREGPDSDPELLRRLGALKAEVQQTAQRFPLPGLRPSGLVSPAASTSGHSEASRSQSGL
jgi:glycine hydroxymethyltransferase